MRNILTTTKITILVCIRNGAFLGILSLIAGVASFIFVISTSDNTILNELQLRIQYSYTLTYSLLTLIIISLSCFTIRSQIDGRQIHMLTAFPIRRRDIWLGKWLGLVIIALISEMILVFSIAICAHVYSRTYSLADVNLARNFYKVIKYEVKPTVPDFDKLTGDRIQKLINDKKIDPKSVDKETWGKNYELLRRSEQLIKLDGEKTWSFDLKKKPQKGEYIDFRFRIYAEKRRKTVQGAWALSAEGKSESFIQEFKCHPYSFTTINIPLSQIPDSGKFQMTLKGKNESDIIVSFNSGITLFYQDGSIINNLVKIMIAHLIHMSVAVAVGLTAGVAFSFSVASFLSITLYFLSASSEYFSSIVKDILTGYHISIIDKISALLISGAMWIAKGLQAPDVISKLSGGISIPIAELIIRWLPAISVYGIVTGLLGMYILTKKELDRFI